MLTSNKPTRLYLIQIYALNIFSNYDQIVPRKKCVCRCEYYYQVLQNVFVDVSTIIKCYKMQSFLIKFVKLKKKERPCFFIKDTACHICSDVCMCLL